MASEKELKESDYSNPKQIIRECLNSSFRSPDEIKAFCIDYYDDLSIEIKNEDTHRSIASKIIEHCYGHAKVDEFWTNIKRERPNQHGLYYPRWELVKDAENDPIGQFTDESEPSKHIRPTSPDLDDKSHPLRGDDKEAIAEWFYNDLTSDEKSMVLVVALFQGINRKHMTAMSKEIHHCLFEE